MPRTRIGLPLFGLLPALLFIPAARAGSPRPEEGCAIVEERSFSASLSAFAAVEPVAAVTVPALVDGTLAGWRALPGMAVRRGEVLGNLGGPERAQEVAAARAAVDQARNALDLAEKTEAVVRETYPAISTIQKLHEARAAVAQTTSALEAAKARWAFVRDEGQIRAPVDGTLTEVYAAQGQAVVAGTILVRMEDASRLWLHAVFYGQDAMRLQPGMRGVFAPAGGGKEVPVRVSGVIAPLRPDGGRAVSCLPLGPSDWISGEAGTLKLDSSAVSWPAVPEAALILKGKTWYVVVRGPAGDEHREVGPGLESEGWRAISRGLKPGEQVVVKDAYLIFHRGVAKDFTPPD